MSATGRSFLELIRYAAQQGAGVGQGTLTDWNPLSVVRTLTEGFAVLGERQGENLAVGLANGIDRATYRSFGFTVIAAEAATGHATFTRLATAQAATVPAGTRLGVPNSTKVYATLDTATFASGVATATVRVRAVEAGAFGNTSAGTVTRIFTLGSGYAVTNALPIVGGTDAESDEARKVRFADFIQSIHRGTSDAVAHGARTAALYDGGGAVVEAVLSAQVADGYATGRCYLWNGARTGATASTALVARAQQIIDGYTDPATGAPVPGYKAAGVAIQAVPATVLPVNVAVSLYLKEGWPFNTVSAGVTQAVAGVFSRLGVGTPRLRLNDLRQAIGTVQGVIDQDFTTPTADVVGGDGVVIVLGTLALTQQ